MSERERWIVYPLLFLALGAALRDKLINSTESQRVKCQGLMVYDSSGDVSMVLGAEQFPDVRQQTVRSQLKVDTIEVATLRVTDNVSFRRIMYEDRRRGVTYSIDGQHVIGLLAWLDGFQRSVVRLQEMAQKLRVSPQPTTPPANTEPGVPEPGIQLPNTEEPDLPQPGTSDAGTPQAAGEGPTEDQPSPPEGVPSGGSVDQGVEGTDGE